MNFNRAKAVSLVPSMFVRLCAYVMYHVMMSVGKYRYHAVKYPYPTEVSIDTEFGYIDVGSVVVQNEYIFVQVRFTNYITARRIDIMLQYCWYHFHFF